LCSIDLSGMHPPPCTGPLCTCCQGGQLTLATRPMLQECIHWLKPSIKGRWCDWLVTVATARWPVWRQGWDVMEFGGALWCGVSVDPLLSCKPTERYAGAFRLSRHCRSRHTPWALVIVRRPMLGSLPQRLSALSQCPPHDAHVLRLDFPTL